MPMVVLLVEEVLLLLQVLFDPERAVDKMISNACFNNDTINTEELLSVVLLAGFVFIIVVPSCNKP